MLPCSFRICDAEILGVVVPLPGLPDGSAGLPGWEAGSQPGTGQRADELRSPSQAFELRQRPLSTVMPLSRKIRGLYGQATAADGGLCRRLSAAGGRVRLRQPPYRLDANQDVTGTYLDVRSLWRSRWSTEVSTCRPGVPGCGSACPAEERVACLIPSEGGPGCGAAPRSACGFGFGCWLVGELSQRALLRVSGRVRYEGLRVEIAAELAVQGEPQAGEGCSLRVLRSRLLFLPDTGQIVSASPQR